MAILSWFKRGTPAATTMTITGSGALRFLSAGNFHGRCEPSPNGRYTLAWRDGDGRGCGGARSEGEGRYLLIDREQIITEGGMERPNDGHVADNGTFVLDDWRFFTGELRGTFYAFRADGSEILRRKFLANLYNCGLAQDGRLACCQTCNSPSERDSAILTVFDLDTGAEIARWRPESGWATGYEFSADNAHILLTYNQGPPLRYTLTGAFVDRTLWVESSLDRGDLYMIQRVIKETHPKPEGAFAQKLVACIDKGLADVRADDPKTRAFGLKLKAVCLEGLEKWTSALAAYEAALALDPKLGVKRRIDQLRKKLSPHI